MAVNIFGLLHRAVKVFSEFFESESSERFYLPWLCLPSIPAEGFRTPRDFFLCLIKGSFIDDGRVEGIAKIVLITQEPLYTAVVGVDSDLCCSRHEPHACEVVFIEVPEPVCSIIVNDCNIIFDPVTIWGIGDELDERLSQLRDDGGTIRDNVKNILETHKFLMDVFYELTGLEKRSLASKYLHFHCPELFFIYDSRARTAINRYVKRPDKKALDNINCDKEYGDFVCRMLELQAFLQERTDCYQSPRTLDSFLLQKGL